MASIRSDTPLPTPANWALAGELKPGDEVFAADGKPTTITATGFEAVSEALEVKMVMDPVTVSLDHDLVIGTPWYGKWAGPTALLSKRERRLAHPIATKRAVLDLPEIELPLDPWAYGYWRVLALPEGTIAVPDHLADDAESRMASAGLDVGRTYRDRGLTYLISPKLDATLSKVGHWPAFRPDYLRAGIKQRRELLGGIVDARARFMSGVSYEAAAPLVQAGADLAMGLGLRSSMPNKGVARLRMSPYDAPMLLRAGELHDFLHGPNRPGFRTDMPYMIRKSKPATGGDFVTLKTEAGTYLVGQAMLPARDH